MRVGDDEGTFGIKDGFQGNDVQGELFNIDEDNELEELEKLMEEEIQQIKHTKPRASVPLIFEVHAYKNLTYWVSEESDEMVSSDDEKVTSN